MTSIVSLALIRLLRFVPAYLENVLTNNLSTI